ncbi:MAG: Uma2 family endonuclease [Leptolyngbyaceae cyanobacterium]
MISQTQVNPPQPSAATQNYPPLQSGDSPSETLRERPSRPEFERRYAAAPDIRKAELIEGVVYVASPLRHRQHGKPHSRVMGWLCIYQALTPGIDSSVEPTVRLDLENEPQPDAVLFIEAGTGGQVSISEDDYIEGAPELVVEIAASSVAIDTGSKKRVYQRNGVQEYVIWQAYENKLDWFGLVDGEYQLLAADEDGIIRSRVFPGLWLDVEALLTDQMARMLEVVQAGVESAEHQEFVERLQPKDE